MTTPTPIGREDLPESISGDEPLNEPLLFECPDQEIAVDIIRKANENTGVPIHVEQYPRFPKDGGLSETVTIVSVAPINDRQKFNWMQKDSPPTPDYKIIS